MCVGRALGSSIIGCPCSAWGATQIANWFAEWIEPLPHEVGSFISLPQIARLSTITSTETGIVGRVYPYIDEERLFGPAGVSNGVGIDHDPPTALGLRDFDGAIGLLVVFEHGDQGPTDGDRGAIERVDEACPFFSLDLVADVESPGLVVGAV